MRNTSFYSIRQDMKMSDIIAENPYCLLLLEHFGITLPVFDKTVHEICLENNIDPELFLIFANLYNGQGYKKKNDLSFADAEIIVKYLKNSHIYYSEEIYPSILDAIHQLAQLNDSLEMALVPKFFVEYFREVTEHLDYENDVVFPYVLGLLSDINGNTHKQQNASYSANDYIEHHDNIEEKLNDLKSLLIKYLPQKNDSMARRKIMLLLSNLEFDLNIHSQIEELILEPMVEKMIKYQKSTAID